MEDLISIEKKKVTYAGACNFCSRGVISSGGYTLLYPYKEVYVLIGYGVKVNMCEECKTKLSKVK